MCHDTKHPYSVLIVIKCIPGKNGYLDELIYLYWDLPVESSDHPPKKTVNRCMAVIGIAADAEQTLAAQHLVLPAVELCTQAVRCTAVIDNRGGSQERRLDHHRDCAYLLSALK